MINLGRLYCGWGSTSDNLRYGEKGRRAQNGEAPPSARERRPVVVWNLTRTCNLHCVHCYADSEAKAYAGELSHDEARAVLEDLAQFKTPAILFSGGEPLLRPDLFELAGYAKSLGHRLTLSTNGTLITPGRAQKIKEAGFSYVGVSLDGIGLIHDLFRGTAGAFERTLAGIRALKAAGQKVGLRMTLTAHTIDSLSEIFQFVEREGIDRVCFYHLVYAGRGRDLTGSDLPLIKARRAIDAILAWIQDLARREKSVEVLTVDNHVDGVYAYLKLLRENSPRAAEVLSLLEWNGGGLYSSGVGIGCIDPQGNVHPDQFWSHHTLGNVRKRKFSEIWTDPDEPLLVGLRNRRASIKGRCSLCQYFDLCGGSLRVRADVTYGDPWAPDPACYLTDEEIGLGAAGKIYLQEKGELFSVPSHEPRV